jgi:DNA-binding HxlR family transcriptional regulator
VELEKITNKSNGAEKRRFYDACGLAHGLDLVGERWALLVIRELLLGPRRFSDLKAALSGISANVLTQRLNELEARHVVTRCKLPPPANVQVYGLTEWGREIEPMVLAMANWAYRSPGHDRMLPLTAVATLLSMKINVDRSKAVDMTLSVGFIIDGTPYRGRLDGGAFLPHSGEAEHPDLKYEGTARGLAARLYGKAPLSQLANDGVLTMTGDLDVEGRFASLFALPPRYQPPQ